MNTPSERAREKAARITKYHAATNSNQPSLERTIALALDEAYRVPDGMFREGMTDRKVLGVLPLTADGCVVGRGAIVYEVSSSGVWTPSPRDLYHRPLAQDCYSTREAAEAARRA